MQSVYSVTLYRKGYLYTQRVRPVAWEQIFFLTLGLLQFSAMPLPEGMIRPAMQEAHVTVREEDGEIRLLVVRAQGLLGTVMVGYRTVPLTAVSPMDYEVILHLYFSHMIIEGKNWGTTVHSVPNDSPLNCCCELFLVLMWFKHNFNDEKFLEQVRLARSQVFDY